MVNSKGGFLVEDGKDVDEDARRKEKERERQRAQQNLDPRTLFANYLICAVLTTWQAMFLDPNLNPKCAECQSMDIDPTYRRVFGCLVCKKCMNDTPEKYSLLTKTECKEVRAFGDTGAK
jgi:DNA-repair protein complementing XP-A cells